MDIATFETAEEFAAFGELGRRHAGSLTSWVNIGGVTLTPKSSTDWYWVNTNEQINYEMRWNPGNPNDSKGTQYCLSIDTSNFLFDDIDCYNSYDEVKFICQSVGRNPSSSRTP